MLKFKIILDISKAFDKEKHGGPLFKLRSDEVSGKLLPSLHHYLPDYYQIKILKGRNQQPRYFSSKFKISFK